MSDSNRDKILRIRAAQDKVRRLPLDEWDPIGIGDVPQAQDEYDSYVGRVVSLIASGSGRFAIASFLFDLETNHMGLSGRGSPIRLEPLAQKLAALADEQFSHWLGIPKEGADESSNVPHLDWIFVSRSSKRSGVATLLLEDIVRVLRLKGYKYLASTFVTDNTESMQWHWRNGFVMPPQQYGASKPVRRVQQHTANGSGGQPAMPSPALQD